mmetsp:Transcript_5707/g.8272  ORF Transcript_5707/g.8272 Transcript_5707/m.8272 type:complete len:389 (-) Transcript_5707:68-1234(-)|eukprot:CAMPEP_0184858602 /NCGR_PEP_ID=MMETSP0580-20130426/3683_1 /TAXON_ID=1118495 /ORGANISM="Dactyliosolen fragilissimus" /LENGTH=388 /DNA_ID=CAMNT_0027354833 /DNA_START=359 /DNA_END=1525 /DNA_ORIENTATION=+
MNKSLNENHPDFKNNGFIIKPEENDVLSGRGVSTNRHAGNELFRRLVASKKDEYVRSAKKEKSRISRNIVEIVRARGGRFINKDINSGGWYDIGDQKATEKTSQALRDTSLTSPTSVDFAEETDFPNIFMNDSKEEPIPPYEKRKGETLKIVNRHKSMDTASDTIYHSYSDSGPFPASKVDTLSTDADLPLFPSIPADFFSERSQNYLSTPQTMRRAGSKRHRRIRTTGDIPAIDNTIPTPSIHQCFSTDNIYSQIPLIDESSMHPYTSDAGYQRHDSAVHSLTSDYSPSDELDIFRSSYVTPCKAANFDERQQDSQRIPAKICNAHISQEYLRIRNMHDYRNDVCVEDTPTTVNTTTDFDDSPLPFQDSSFDHEVPIHGIDALLNLR